MFKKFPRIRWITFLITLVSPQIAFSFYLLIYNLSLYKFLNNLPRNSLESNLAVIIIFFIFPFSFYCFTTLIYSKKVITDKKNAEFFRVSQQFSFYHMDCDGFEMILMVA